MTPYANALWDYEKRGDYHNTGKTHPLYLNTSYGDRDIMPTQVFFRTADQLSHLEHHALECSTGHVLDMGAGSGCISLILQDKGLNVTATDIDPDLCALMKHRGVKNTLCADIYQMQTKTKYDTILSLMNGVGIAGTLDNLPHYLTTLKSHMTDGGQIIMDSTDISYLYEDGTVQKPNGYKGEISYQYQYGDNTGDWFPWLFVDSETLIKTAEKCELTTQIIYQDDTGEDAGHYLVRMTA